MNRKDADEIAEWLAEAGLLGMRDEASLAKAFCERCVAAGLPLGRAFIMIDTLHPLHESRAFFWDEDPTVHPREEELGSSREGEGLAVWQTSPFFHLIQRRETVLRCRLGQGETRGYKALEELRTAGQTDYLAIVYRIRHAARVEDVDGFYARFTTARPEGFGDDEIAHLTRLAPLLGLAIRSASQTRLARSLVEAYLGRDPGRRVLNGGFRRGAVEKINAVLWFSDMTGFTRLSETVETDQLIPLLNDYAETVITAVQSAGGDVLKLVGDGVLAIFSGKTPSAACSAALTAEQRMRAKLAALDETRRKSGQPVAGIYLGLHVGDVFYGNIGSADRLDFTVVGPAVNEVNRIASMCGSVDRDNLMSHDFVALLPPHERERMVSVGRFALKGVGRAQQLFTRDPALPGHAEI